MPVLVKIMTIKLNRRSILIQLQKILWTCCVFLSSINNTFFTVLVIIFSNKNYFCFNDRNIFFIHAMNYFSMVLRIIFLMCIKNYFLIGPRIIFRGIANLFFGLQCIAGLAFEVDWFESLTSLGDHFENFEVEECFQRECQGEKLSGKETKGVFIFLTKSVRSQQSVRSWWGFLDRRFNRGDYEATSRLLHNSNPYWTWHVCPIGLFSTHTCWVSKRRRREWECPLPWG